MGLAVYLPWLLFSWQYYGNPIPQTVIAKSQLDSEISLDVIFERLLQFPKVSSLTFLPPYAQFDTWEIFKPFAVILSLVCNFMWIFQVPRFVRVCSFTAFGMCLYLSTIPNTYPWYFPPILLLSLPCLHYCLVELGHAVRRSRILPISVHVLSGFFCLIFIVMYIEYSGMARHTFQHNEVEVRIALGKWLKHQVLDGEKVYLECPGYIGFFSMAEIYDYPGLVSPAVSSIAKTAGTNIVTLGWKLQPEWLVLRPNELSSFISQLGEEFTSKYKIIRVFDNKQVLADLLPFHRGVQYDSSFYVLKRVTVNSTNLALP